jgi:hypothetical protein
MAILGSAIDITYRKGGSASLDGLKRSYSQHFMVESDITNELEANLVFAPGIPSLFSPHPSDLLSLAQEYSITREPSNRYVYYVEVKYSSEFDSTNGTSDGEGQPQAEAQNPLDRAPKISWSSVKKQKAVWKDKNGNAIITQAGEYFIDTPPKDDSNWTITIESNEVSPSSLSWLLTFPNKLNENIVTLDGVSFPAETLKCEAISISPQLFANNVNYRKVTVTLTHNGEGFDMVLLHRGFKEKNPFTQEIEVIKFPLNDILGVRLSADDKTRTKPTGPTLLDHTGAVLENPTLADADFQWFEIYDLADFTALTGVT